MLKKILFMVLFLSAHIQADSLISIYQSCQNVLAEPSPKHAGFIQALGFLPHTPKKLIYKFLNDGEALDLHFADLNYNIKISFDDEKVSVHKDSSPSQRTRECAFSDLRQNNTCQTISTLIKSAVTLVEQFEDKHLAYTHSPYEDETSYQRNVLACIHDTLIAIKHR